MITVAKISLKVKCAPVQAVLAVFRVFAQYQMEYELLLTDSMF